MKYVYITLFLLHKADKISSVKVRYEREADINRAKDLCIMDDLFFALEPVKRTSIFGRKISHL